MNNSPAFGQADLTNCERELIHLAGSVQPHGALLVLDPVEFTVVQASANCGAILGIALPDLLGRPVAVLGPALDAALRAMAPTLMPEETRPLRVRLTRDANPLESAEYEAIAHRIPGQGLIVEIEPLAPDAAGPETVNLPPELLVDTVATAVQRIGAAANQGVLVDTVVQILRDLTGYDRVMVYKFDPDGHGKIVAEARHPRLDTLLGHHYPASDIPQRARELYLRTRVRVLVDVHYQPSPIEPRLQPGLDRELDMSLCYLRSMSPLHIQYLQNMGVNATLVVSLVREGQLWGLIACHHDSPRNLRYPVRAACEMLAEVIAMRLAAIENFALAQVDILVRRLEQRLIEATSTEGDWRLALLRNPRTLLQPLEATGAALFFEDEILTSGEVPSTPELRVLLKWFHTRTADGLFSTASVGRDNPELASIVPTASGVLAVKLSETRPDYLAWFRKEQLQTVTWAGDPNKPVVGNDPLELSPRRSFAAWSEIVRGTAVPWNKREVVFARAIGSALVDIITQVNAVRLLIAEHQIAQVRATIGSSTEPVFVAGIRGAPSFPNPSFCALVGRDARALADSARAGIEVLAQLFVERDTATAMLVRLRTRHEAWRGEVHVLHGDGRRIPVGVRAEVVPGRDGSVLGFIIILVDRTDRRRAAAALQHLEESLSQTADATWVPGSETLLGQATDPLVGALLANASMAAMDVSDVASGPSVAPTLEEIEGSVQRATVLYSRIREYGAAGTGSGG